MSFLLSAGAIDVIPDSAVFDDWADNRLTSRENFDTTSYQFESLAGTTTDDRPEWEHQAVDSGGTLDAQNQRMRIEWGGGSPVTFVGVESSINFSEVTTWYFEHRYSSFSGSSSPEDFGFLFATEDASTRRSGDCWEVDIDTAGEDVRLTKTVDGSKTDVIGPTSVTINLDTDYGVLIERDNSGNWEVFWDPDDPANPQASESIGTAQDSFVPDMSATNAGLQYTWTHDSNVAEIDRLEVF